MLHNRNPFEVLQFVVHSMNSALAAEILNGSPKHQINSMATKFYGDVAILSFCFSRENCRNDLMRILNMLDSFTEEEVIRYAKAIIEMDPEMQEQKIGEGIK